MAYYFAEVDVDTKEIVSFSDSTSIDMAPKDTTGLMVQITEEQYKMLVACRGNLTRGATVLGHLDAKIKQAIYEKLESEKYE